MRDAFDAGAEFLVRVNDDTEFVTPGWVRLGVDALAAFEPPNVGVVGPVCREGKTRILTHDMVHRTHLTIFDTYYPPEFSNWFVDDWISRVYGAARTRRHEGWVVKHRLTPTRYMPEERERELLGALVAKAAALIKHRLHHRHKDASHFKNNDRNLNTTERTIDAMPNLNQEIKFTIVVTVSQGFDDMFRNWLYWYEKIGVNARLVVYAEDGESFIKYRDCSQFTLKLASNESAGSAFSYDTERYNALVSRRPGILLSCMHEFGDLIYSDIDVIWKQSPIPWLVGDYDLWVQDDKGIDNACTGFLALRKSSAVVSMLTEWKKNQENTKQTNQKKFNKLLKISNIKTCHLRATQFVNGFDFFETKSMMTFNASAIVMIHNNYIIGKENKKRRFRDRNLWSPIVGNICQNTYVNKTMASPVYSQNKSVRGMLIVMTMNRKLSLERLLKSLVDAQYDGDVVDLHIWIDLKEDNAAPDQSILQVCRMVPWIHGQKITHIHPKKAGLRGQWLDTWRLSISDEEKLKKMPILVLLEDDIEVSPFFWRWLKLGHQAYANRSDIAGLSLGRLNHCPKFCPNLNGGNVTDNSNFLHPWVGTTGFSPTTKHWENFTNWAREYQKREAVEKPYVPGMRPTEWYKQFEKVGRCPGINCMWTQLHHYYTMNAPDRYTVRAKCAGGLALAVNHQEAGLHYANKMNADAKLLKTSFPEKLKKFYPHPDVVGLDGRLSRDVR